MAVSAAQYEHLEAMRSGAYGSLVERAEPPPPPPGRLLDTMLFTDSDIFQVRKLAAWKQQQRVNARKRRIVFAHGQNVHLYAGVFARRGEQTFSSFMEPPTSARGQT